MNSIVRIICATIVWLTFWVYLSLPVYTHLSHNLCIRDSRFHQPELRDAIVEVAAIFTKSGLPMSLSCRARTAIRLVTAEELADPQTIGQTAINGLFRSVNGEEHFLPLIIPRWPLQKIEIRRDRVDLNTISYSKTYFQLILIHEIGHVLGLGHSEDPNDVMYPEIQSSINIYEAVQQVKERSYVQFK